MIKRKCFNSLNDINEWRAEEGKDVKIINIDYSEPANYFYVVWFEYNEKEEYTKKTVHPISRDGSRSDMSVPVNILLKNGGKCKGRYDYDKCMWVVEIEDDQVQGWEYM